VHEQAVDYDLNQSMLRCMNRWQIMILTKACYSWAIVNMREWEREIGWQISRQTCNDNNNQEWKKKKEESKKGQD